MLMETRVIECPIRRAVISALECHSCHNSIRVLYRSEFPPEYQCVEWMKFLTEERAEVEEDPAP